MINFVAHPDFHKNSFIYMNRVNSTISGSCEGKVLNGLQATFYASDMNVEKVSNKEPA